MLAPFFAGNSMQGRLEFPNAADPMQNHPNQSMKLPGATMNAAETSKNSWKSLKHRLDNHCNPGKTDEDHGRPMDYNQYLSFNRKNHENCRPWRRPCINMAQFWVGHCPLGQWWETAPTRTGTGGTSTMADFHYHFHSDLTEVILERSRPWQFSKARFWKLVDCTGQTGFSCRPSPRGGDKTQINMDMAKPLCRRYSNNYCIYQYVDMICIIFVCIYYLYICKRCLFLMGG